MKTRFLRTLLVPFLCTVPLVGKPPAEPGDDHFNPAAAWLLAQGGGEAAVTLPLREAVHAITGKTVLPFDPANASDKAFLARLSSVMDRVLPRLNRPDCPAQMAARRGALDEAVTRIEEDITGVYSSVGGFADLVGRSYPSFRLMGMPSGRPYYLAVVLYTPKGRAQATRSASMTAGFCIDPAEVRARIAVDACCLLIGIEYEPKTAGGWAFLNWDVTDVRNTPVHAAVTFQADAADVYHPGAILTDGRKGSD